MYWFGVVDCGWLCGGLLGVDFFDVFVVVYCVWVGLDFLVFFGFCCCVGVVSCCCVVGI